MHAELLSETGQAACALELGRGQTYLQLNILESLKVDHGAFMAQCQREKPRLTVAPSKCSGRKLNSESMLGAEARIRVYKRSHNL